MHNQPTLCNAISELQSDEDNLPTKFLMKLIEYDNDGSVKGQLFDTSFMQKSILNGAYIFPHMYQLEACNARQDETHNQPYY